jgi:hypothetical protein
MRLPFLGDRLTRTLRLVAVVLAAIAQVIFVITA